ncbi:MAG: GntR family transcriptional regulator [Clostridiales bacterium]|nr:GntR family transcriptional regulator [Clostridiales bacterium]
MKLDEISGKKTVAKYEKIAVDIAYSILNDEWEIGEVVKGRSTLSGKYSVSPETIRRALKLLEDLEVVEIVERKGVIIKSKTAADTFIKEYQSKDSILTLREEIANLSLNRRNIEDSILEKIDLIIEQAMILRNVGIIYPLEIKVPADSPIIGKSIGEIRFWEHTGATIIGIIRTGHLYLSPGPKLVFYADDLILYVGNAPNISGKIQKLVYKSTV